MEEESVTVDALKEATPKSQIQVRTMPSAKMLMLTTSGIDFSELTVGTGPHGVVRKGDVLEFIKNGKSPSVDPRSAPRPAEIPAEAAPPPTSPTTRRPDSFLVEMTQMRRVIGSRLTQSKLEIPHFYVSYDVDMTDVASTRRQLVARDPKARAPSVNDFVVKAAALALRESGRNLNSTFVDGNSILSDSIDVSIAVATPDGLITPIVPSADSLTPFEISAKIGDLASRAKSGTLKLSEFQGGSFTISNLGMFGVDEFSAVVNPPQTAIMAVGAGVPDEDGRPIMTVCLSCDGRAIDAFEASRFLKTFKEFLETPLLLL